LVGEAAVALVDQCVVLSMASERRRSQSGRGERGPRVRTVQTQL